MHQLLAFLLLRAALLLLVLSVIRPSSSLTDSEAAARRKKFGELGAEAGEDCVNITSSSQDHRGLPPCGHSPSPTDPPATEQPSTDLPTAPSEMSCDLALICSVQTEIQGKLDEIIEDSLQFKQVLRFGGFASGGSLVLFIGYLLIVALMGIVRYAKDQQEKQVQERAKEADRAAKKLYKKNRAKSVDEAESML